eukprot:TRINITY_DN64368_c0_g1_i1.p1 TRINITY_DN64368_c0_g1~~TRINITY_DN64368_c0_g1_i1.p1  ORF type:complete len:336 (+),score=42.50 TRINITY_DN64368_c0_g1_i1:95-1102(+)
MEKFSVLRQSEGSLSVSPALGVVGRGALLDTVALDGHNRTCRSVMGVLVGSAKTDNRPASSHYFGFNVNLNDVPIGNANALHIHKTMEYFLAYTGDFEIRAGNDAYASIRLKKFDMIVVPPFYKRFFKCIATTDQTHFCEEMKEHANGECALILAGIAGQPWVQWSFETITKAKENNVVCTSLGLLYDEGSDPPHDEPRQEELDCTQEELEACVLRAADRPVVHYPFGDGDIRFEYVELLPEVSNTWNADSQRNYCAWLLEGPQLKVRCKDASNVDQLLLTLETLVIPKGDAWSLSLGTDCKSSALVFLISSNMTEASFPSDVMTQIDKSVTSVF